MRFRKSRRLAKLWQDAADPLERAPVIASVTAAGRQAPPHEDRAAGIRLPSAAGTAPPRPAVGWNPGADLKLPRPQDAFARLSVMSR